MSGNKSNKNMIDVLALISNPDKYCFKGIRNLTYNDAICFLWFYNKSLLHYSTLTTPC